MSNRMHVRMSVHMSVRMPVRMPVRISVRMPAPVPPSLRAAAQPQLPALVGPEIGPPQSTAICVGRSAPPMPIVWSRELKKSGTSGD